jgi:predicted PurR-regulated permease PerM
MVRRLRASQLWIAFGGCILIVAILDWAEPVLMPVAVALLLTFLLNPPVTFLQRWLRRGPAVILVVALTFATLGLLGWVMTRQMTSLAAQLPSYRDNIRQKIVDIRASFRGGAVDQVQSTLEKLKQDIAKAEAGGAVAKPERVATPVVLANAPEAGLGLPVWLTSLVEPLATAGLVTVLVIFMLLEHRDMRDRFLRLIGVGHLASTTKAFDDAAERLSRYLLMQSLINLIYGAGVGFGLWWLGVPYPILWGALGAILRFIPYVGPWIAAAAPLLVAFAALPDWTSTVWVAILFVALELFTNLVLETVWYAGVAGVTQVALLIALAFWTWLWGPVGLLLATPLTVCLVVLGKHVRGLRFVATLIADEPVLTDEARFYQRLLAREPHDAREIVAAALKDGAPAEVYKRLFLGTQAFVDRDRADRRIGSQDADDVSKLMSDIATEFDLPQAAESPAEVAVTKRSA